MIKSMEEKEIKLMKGNEAIAHAAIRCGTDGYFGYPITPQSEIIETLALTRFQGLSYLLARVFRRQLRHIAY